MSAAFSVWNSKEFPDFAPRTEAESLSRSLSVSVASGDDSSTEYSVLPGFCDVHVHFREPGFSYKETIRSGSLAAAAGGYTAVCTMPNLNPVPDSPEHLDAQQALIDDGAAVAVYPYASVTVGQKGQLLSPLAELAPRCIAFSDDGKGIQSAEMMELAMREAKALGKIIAAHCEDESLVRGGYIHDGAYAAAHGHRGISSESEWRPIARDLDLAAKTGCAYHVCHVSCRESVELIRQAKRSGVNVTAETAPHYLLLSENDLCEDGKWKMNPPLRSEDDRLALIEGILDGTVDMIATDHAPHSAEEKAKGLAGSSFGIVGLETAFPVLYTGLVKPGVLSLDRLVSLMAVNPRRRFGIPYAGDFAVWDLHTAYTVDPSGFESRGRAMPFEGRTVFGRCWLTSAGGKAVYRRAL